MNLARLPTVAMAIFLMCLHPGLAQTTGAELPPASYAGASVAPPPPPAVEEIVADPSVEAAVPASGPAPRVTRQVSRAPRIVAAPRRSAQITPATTGVETLRLGPATPSDAFPDDTRVMPLHVARKRARLSTYSVPKGYRPAWDDDRLNPNRAIGTLGGQASMDEIWTKTVPRRLIDRPDGRARSRPTKVYPLVAEPAPGLTTLSTRHRETKPSARPSHGAGVGR
jgi:hypothetical protein